MKIEYGEDTNGDGRLDNYYSAEQVGDWSRVLSVFIILFFSTKNKKMNKWPIYIALKQKRLI